MTASPFRIVALLTVRNEAAVLRQCLEHLHAQGIETCLIDHGSEDETLRIADTFRDRGVFRIERLPYEGVFRLDAQLRQKEQLASEIAADWFMHLDADEIRESARAGWTLRDAIADVDRAGWNAIDFDEFVFVPTTDDEAFDGRDFVAGMRWYYYFEPPSPDRFRINAWKKQPTVDLHTHAGHQVLFAGRRVCPETFVLRHYPLLSRAHAALKYGNRRFAPEERARLWHADRVRLEPARLRWPSRDRLKRLDESGTFDRSDPWQRHFWMQDAPPSASSKLPLLRLRAFKTSQGANIPTISAITADKRPFWSVMIPTFNPNPNYLRETLSSVLADDPGPDDLQIEVIDDGSRGDVQAVAAEVGRGRIEYVGRAENIGIIRNWNVCVERARGRWVHLLHQDDRVLPGFYRRLRTPCETVPDLVAAFCRGAGIDDQGRVVWTQEPERPDGGVLVDLLERLAIEQRVLTPAIVVRRDAYEKIGGYHLGLTYCADWDFYKRLALLGPIWYEPASLACWRQHQASTSARMTTAGADLADRRRSIELSRAYLPVEYVGRATSAALRGALLWHADILRDSLLRDDLATALTQSREIVTTLLGIVDSSAASRPSPDADAMQARVEELEAQVQAWMRAARQLTKQRVALDD